MAASAPTHRLTPDAKHRAGTRLMPLATLALAAFTAAAGLAGVARAEEPLQAVPAASLRTSGSLRLTPGQRVAIPTFIVQLARDQGIERSGGSFGMFGGQSATYTVQTRGLDAGALQALADALHDAFVEDLKAAGHEVVAPADLIERPDFQELRGAGKPSPLIEEVESGTGRKQTLSVQLLTSARGLPVLRGAVPDERWLPPTLADGMNARAYALGGAKLSYGLQAALLNVRLTLSMAEPKGKGSGGVSAFGNLRIASASWQFEADPDPRFVEGGSQMQVSLSGNEYNADRAGVVLSRPVPITGLTLSAAAGEGGNARGSGLLGALSRAVGGTADSAADAYLEVDPADFSPRATVEGRRVLRGFIAAMSKP